MKDDKKEKLRKFFWGLALKAFILTVGLTLLYIWIENYKLAHKVGGTALLTGIIAVILAIVAACQSENNPFDY